MNITSNERLALRAVLNSEYQCGDSRECVVGNQVWTSYCNPFDSKRTFSGVVASLVKKGLVTTGGGPADANYQAGCDGTTLALTLAGYDAARNAPRNEEEDGLDIGPDGMLDQERDL